MFHPLSFAAIVVVLGLGTYLAAIFAIRSYEQSKQPKRNSLADVHDIHKGLPEISPAPDTSTRYLDALFGGEQTGAWPMIWELRKETPALPARERFADMRTVIEGELVTRQPLEITATYADYPAIHETVTVGGRR